MKPPHGNRRIKTGDGLRNSPGDWESLCQVALESPVEAAGQRLKEIKLKLLPPIPTGDNDNSNNWRDNYNNHNKTKLPTGFTALAQR